MFGPQRNFENRIVEYRSNVVGIKHLHRLNPPLTNLSRPQPNQPIGIYHVYGQKAQCFSVGMNARPCELDHRSILKKDLTSV